MDINKDNAMALLEAMLADSAADFEGGYWLISTQ